MKNITFDDVTINDNKTKWSQICECCRNKYNIVDDKEISLAYNEGSGICGIEGCNNESDHYIDFK